MLRKVFRDLRFSPLYRSAAQEITDQPEFLNAAAVFETALTPEKVASELKKIEKKLKKNLPERFGPRTIDIDILLYGNEILLDDTLTIPHLKLHTRRFVLEPLIALGAGDLLHPGFDRRLKFYLEEIREQHCEKTALGAL